MSGLSELPRGVPTLAGVRFDIRSVIQLGARSRRGEPYPRQLSGINIGVTCQRLQLLHSAITAFDVEPGTRIGSHVVHYTDGQRREIPIMVGRDVADWFRQDNEDPTQMQVAWTGGNESSRTQAMKDFFILFIR